ncbi:MAG: AraC family transcriptional regulator [Bacteroidales bacterium]|nr:AraC family transcriptional regulator [Bacteroidales bacterium]
MKNTNIKEVTNDTRSVAAQYDKRKVNNYRPDFSLIMDFRLLMKDTGITLNQPYRTMEQRLLFVTGGNAVAEFNAIEYKLCKNVLILMPENCTMELLSASEDFNAHGLAFKVRGGENFGFIQYNALRMPLSDREGAFMEKYFQLFDELFSMAVEDPKPSECLCSFVMFYLHNLYNNLYGENPFISRQQKMFNDFIVLVNRCALTERSVAYYAKQLNTSSNYLSVIIKEQSNKTAKEWINHIVAREAKLMLKGVDEKVEKVAEMLGFHNAAQFGTFFKKHTGQTPMEYRNGKGIPLGEAEEKINS